MNWLRRLADQTPLRFILLKPRIRRHIANVMALRFLAAALVVDRPAAYLWEWVRRGTDEQAYRLRDGGQVAVTPRSETEAFYEVFLRHDYEPPPKVSEVLGNPRLILDIGANVGFFSAYAIGRWPDAMIEAFEPDPESASTYRRRSGPRCILHEEAAAISDGEVRFTDKMGTGSHIAREDEPDAIVVPGRDIFGPLERADLAKIDIEGAEWPILADPRLASLSSLVIVLEYHRVGAPSLPARAAAVKLLTQAGFSTGFGSNNYWGQGILWAWKP